MPPPDAHDLTARMENLADRVIRFGVFAFDPGRRLLTRGTEELSIGGRPLGVLIALLARPGSVLSPQELISRAWPRSAVTKANLRAYVSSLRRVLRDGEEGHRYIQNVPGRGYRFVSVSGQAASPSNAPRPLSGPAVPPGEIGAIGRDQVVTAILSKLRHRRLVTLVGPGGIGKTTVASAVVRAFSSSCPDAIQWVDLGSLARDDSPAEAIARALGLTSFTGDQGAALLSRLGSPQRVLVLDCCDRVVDETAALVERILRETDGVRILATSREALRADEEQVVRLPPLAVPDGSGLPSVEEALAYPAIQLFVERAAAALGGFVLSPKDVPYVVEICARLDGIALAIELAAGHLIAIELSTLAGLLNGKFRLLAAGRRTAAPRHQSMDAVLEWSYETLTPAERQALLGLSFFEGEAAVEAIHAVIANAEVSQSDLIGAIARLVDKSMVSTKVTPEGLRYFLFGTTRAFALHRLKETDGVGQRRRE